MGGWARGAPGGPGGDAPAPRLRWSWGALLPHPSPTPPGSARKYTPCADLGHRRPGAGPRLQRRRRPGVGGAERAALVALRCWGVEWAGGSRMWGCLVVTARCCGSQGGNSICLCLQVGSSFLSFLFFFLLSALRLEETVPGSFSPPPTCHWHPHLGALSLHSLLQHLALPAPSAGGGGFLFLKIKQKH